MHTFETLFLRIWSSLHVQDKGLPVPSEHFLRAVPRRLLKPSVYVDDRVVSLQRVGDHQPTRRCRAEHCHAVLDSFFFFFFFLLIFPRAAARWIHCDAVPLHPGAEILRPGDRLTPLLNKEKDLDFAGRDFGGYGDGGNEAHRGIATLRNTDRRSGAEYQRVLDA